MTSETVPPTTLKLADHFPLVSKKCQKQASVFFECFYTKGEQPPEGVSKQQCIDNQGFPPAVVTCIHTE